MRCQRCGNVPTIMIERDGKHGKQQAIVCGGCILSQYIEFTEEDEKND